MTDSTNPVPSRRPFWRWIGVAVLVAVLDQLTKQWIIASFQWGDTNRITSYFNIVRAHNSGAAFSFLAGHGGWQRWFFVGVAALATVFIVWQLYQHGQQRLSSFAFALILGGALGNVTDRLMHGYVVDFLDFHLGGRHFAAFNLADTAITMGVIGILLAEALRWRAERNAQAPQ